MWRVLLIPIKSVAALVCAVLRCFGRRPAASPSPGRTGAETLTSVAVINSPVPSTDQCDWNWDERPVSHADRVQDRIRQYRSSLKQSAVNNSQDDTTEPDYFQDMTPTVRRAPTITLQTSKSDISDDVSRLNYVEPTKSCELTEWAEVGGEVGRDGSGWEDTGSITAPPPTGKLLAASRVGRPVH